MTKRLDRPRDPAQLAKLILDIATGEVKDDKNYGKNPVAVESGRRGGLKGSEARNQRLTPEERTKLSQKAAKARWKKD